MEKLRQQELKTKSAGDEYNSCPMLDILAARQKVTKNLFESGQDTYYFNGILFVHKANCYLYPLDAKKELGKQTGDQKHIAYSLLNSISAYVDLDKVSIHTTRIGGILSMPLMELLIKIIL